MIQFQESIVAGVNACLAAVGFCICAVGALCALYLVCAAISGIAKMLEKHTKGDE